MTILEYFALVIINGLSIFTVTFIAKDLDGPKDSIRRIRMRFGVVYSDPADRDRITAFKTEYAKLFDCFWCLGFWTGLMVTIGFSLTFLLPVFYALWLWFAGLAIAGTIYKFVMS